MLTGEPEALGRRLRSVRGADGCASCGHDACPTAIVRLGLFTGRCYLWANEKERHFTPAIGANAEVLLKKSVQRSAVSIVTSRPDADDMYHGHALVVIGFGVRTGWA